MRLPLAIPLDARDGLTDQDGRMTNVVAEVYEDKTFVTSRPALNLEAERTGAANGIFCFNGQIITVWGTTIQDRYVSPVSAYSSGATYATGDLVIYAGTIWLSLTSGNQGNTPSYGGGYWTTYTDWNEGTNYDIGDSVNIDGVTYYSLSENNINTNPVGSLLWSQTQPGAGRFRGSVGTAGWNSPGEICASKQAAGYSLWAKGPYISCPTRNQNNMFYTYYYVSDSLQYLYQYTASGGNCNSLIDQGPGPLITITTL